MQDDCVCSHLMSQALRVAAGIFGRWAERAGTEGVQQKVGDQRQDEQSAHITGCLG